MAAPETFWGQSSTFWTGVNAVAMCVYTAVVTVSIWFLYQQVRTAAKGFQLDAIRRLQELVDDFREQRRRLFATLPLDLALTHEQFPAYPPRQTVARRPCTAEAQRISLTEAQQRALDGLSPEQLEIARHVIGRLNDIGELVEDGIIDRRVFLGKYHVMVIQCCHLVEAIRRRDEGERGGNYGQRLLRMRHWAIAYNDISPKHRGVPITVTDGHTRRLVYRSPTSGIWKRVGWTLKRWTGHY